MGLEARCGIHWREAGGTEHTGEGAVHLDDAELTMRGDARHRVPRASITSVEVADGALVVRHAAGVTTLALGSASQLWAARLAQAPRSIVDKLDVRQGASVSVVDVDDPELLEALAARTTRLTRGGIAAGSDVVLLGVHRAADLARIAPAVPRLAPGGCIWALHPRGVPEVADTAIFAAAKAAGLTYTKVARVSDALTGEKLVRPRAAR